MALTPDQKACMEHVDGPLLVSAGAGSGKTFMLTQRIAYALLNSQKSGVDSIDQVLAITFTELAASEIKARVRNELRKNGLAAEALKVDACWISTIHGMCSRILRENALELGLDPQFGLLDETDRDQLLADCIDAALAESAPLAADTPGEPQTSSPYGTLFGEFESSGGGASAVGDMLRELVNTAANVRGGLDAVRFVEPLEPHQIAVEMRDAMQELDAVAREGINAAGKATESFTIDARNALEHPQIGMPLFERLAANRALTAREIAGALQKVDLSFGSRTRKEPYAGAYAQFRATYVKLCLEAALGLAQTARDELLALARRVQCLFDEQKTRQGVLDQNDLLLRTLDAFEHNDAVRARYSDRFRLVMVDEFQDTSALQIALIGHLTCGDRTLCTVGDTQQSIYRFRGADVATYRAHKEHMRALEGQGGMYRELDINWRSHGDIITFVNRVFGAPEVFGSSGEFIELGFDKNHAQEKKNAFPKVPRIDVVCTSYLKGKGAGTDEAHLVEAEAIARRFEALHETGSPNCSWGDMVILLGKMSRADVYARTLRAHGIPCIITGGSGFSRTPEALEVCALLEAIANPRDNVALRKALSGAAFSLGADDLLKLATTNDLRKRDLWDGLRTIGLNNPSPRVQLAASVMCDAVNQAGARTAAELLMGVAIESGWLDRLQGDGPQGMASAANVLKTVRLAEKIERGTQAPRGLSSTAARLALELDQGIKEKPGTLMTEGQDAVRILTVHASKGLEFPIVALADFYGLKPHRGSLLLETVGETIWLSLKPGALMAKGAPFENLLETKLTEVQLRRLEGTGYEPGSVPIEDASTAGELHQAVLAHAREEELGELRRKFYVGATRPREALIVSVNGPETKDGTWNDVVADLCRAVFGPEGDFCTAPEGIDLGGEERAVTQRIRLGHDENANLLVGNIPASEFLQPAMLGSATDSTTENIAPATERIPEAPRPGERMRDLEPGLRPCDPTQAGTFSYTAIAPAELAEDRAPRAPLLNDDAPARHGDPRAFGSALHQACELMVEGLVADRAAGNTQATLTLPSDHALSTCLATWGLTKDAMPALLHALELWAGSNTASKVLRHATLLPESPFFVALQGPQGEPIHLEGAIDLLCWDASRDPGAQTALVVDYKTGGARDETQEELRAKHELQAACYAYALFCEGFDAVELHFVRVQHADAACAGQPQTVRYHYGHEDMQGLSEAIRAAYVRAR